LTFWVSALCTMITSYMYISPHYAQSFRQLCPAAAQKTQKNLEPRRCMPLGGARATTSGRKHAVSFPTVPERTFRLGHKFVTTTGPVALRRIGVGNNKIQIHYSSFLLLHVATIVPMYLDRYVGSKANDMRRYNERTTQTATSCSETFVISPHSLYPRSLRTSRSSH
jgi:hypothetical protein